MLKLLEGQRHVWKAQRLQTRAGKSSEIELAKLAFREAIASDPALAEAYTALAEIAVAMPPGDMDEAIALASKAVQLDRDNFGGHRMLARLYTVRSRINSGQPLKAFVGTARSEWLEVTRLDPRNAEGWAFLAAFAEAEGNGKEQISALKNWISAASPLDVQFYSRMMNGAELSPETATLKLAGVVAAAGDNGEAAKLLSVMIADNAENAEAVTLLGDLIDSSEGQSALLAVGPVEHAVNANPANPALISMLARLHVKLGRETDAITLLKRHIDIIGSSDRAGAAPLYAALSDIYFDLDRLPDAAAALEGALSARGIGTSPTRPEDQEFASYIFEKLIHVWKLAEKPSTARTVIERARKVFGNEDGFADDQLIGLLQEQGRFNEALALVRKLRAKKPSDQGLLRAEASLLTLAGNVDAGVRLFSEGISRGAQGPDAGTGSAQAQLPPSDRFSELLFISNLYIRAGRFADAVSASNEAITLAVGRERDQIARVALASAQHASGQTQAAEATLRKVLEQMPNSPIALNNLGYFFVERGERLEEAVRLILQALKIDQRNANYLDSLGWAYFKLGKLDLAERNLRAAAKLDLRSAAIQEHLGNLYRQKGEKDKARVYFARALKLSFSPSDAERLRKEIGK